MEILAQQYEITRTYYSALHMQLCSIYSVEYE